VQWRESKKGYVFEASGSFFVRFWDTQILPNGTAKRVQRSELLRVDDEGNYSKEGPPCKNGDKFSVTKSRGKRTLSPSLKLALNSFIQIENARQANGRISVAHEDMRIVDFW